MSGSRKGWCPGALRPMRSGDGLIVRLRLSCGELSSAQAHEIAALAGSHGHGEIDLTARGHLQLRGIDDAAYPSLIESLAAAGLVDASPQVEAVRNVLVTPFAGFDGPFDVRPCARAWERALALSPVLWRLPAKFGVSFDAGGFPLGDESDIRFEAQDGRTFVARLAGGQEVLGPFAKGELVAVARALTHAFLAVCGEAPRRMRDAVRAQGLKPFAAAAGLPVAFAPQAPRAAAAADWLGVHALRAHAFAGVAAPFGRLRSNQLAALADACGPAGMRLTPWRALLVPGLDQTTAREFVECARGLGLIVDPADPLLRVAACVGAPACSSALGETREAARRLAPLAPRGEGIWLHVSGCAKGCAHPRPAPLTVVASREGYQLNGEAPRSLDALAERIA